VTPVLALHHPERRRDFPRIGSAHLVISTYPLLRWDHETLGS